MTQLLSSIVNAGYARERPAKDIDDPAYIVTTADNGYLLKWRSLDQALWTLAADALPNIDVLCFQADIGVLGFEPEAPGNMACGFPGHNSAAGPLCYVQLTVDTNPDGAQAQWVLSGATGITVFT